MRQTKTQQFLVLLFSHSVVVALLTSQVQWSQATLQNKQLWAVLIRHSVIVKLITSHYKVKFITVNFSYACLWSRYCAPSRPYPRTRLSESFTRPGYTNSNTHSINLGKTKSKPNEAFTTKQSQDSEIFQGATPLSYPQRSKLAPRRTQGLGNTAVNDWEPQTGLVDTAESCPDPKQYSVQYLAQS